MKEHTLKPDDSRYDQANSIKGRYRQFRFTLLLTITVISLIPAIIMSVTGYFQYLNILERQEVIQLKWHADYTHSFLEENLPEELGKETVSPELKKSLRTINKKILDDTFLVDRTGNLLTDSRLFPDLNTLTVTDDFTQQQVIDATKSIGIGKRYFLLTPINGSGWVLVLIKDGPIHKGEWWFFQLELISIFLACTIFSLFIIYHLVNLLTYRIRVSDIKRMKLFSEIGHTNRLATIGRLAAGVAHEINNPLAVIDQKAGLIDDYLEFSENFPNKEKFGKAITGINDNVARCKIITHRLLGFARKMEVNFEPVQFNQVIQDVLGFLEKEALYNHIAINLNLATKLPEIVSDKGQLEQILLNIVNNAIDAIGKNGEITIESRTIKKKIQIDISDNGPGIEPSIMKHIFDPFFTTKETGKGTGLGLAITYGLTTKLGGDIKVKSVIGEGTCFTLTFPIKQHNK